jgi:hypothetical protein
MAAIHSDAFKRGMQVLSVSWRGTTCVRYLSQSDGLSLAITSRSGNSSR